MKYLNILLLGFLLSHLSLAESELNKLSLSDLKIQKTTNDNPDNGIFVKESKVKINGLDFKQLEFQKKIFYLKFNTPDEQAVTSEDCLRRPKADVPPSRVKFVVGEAVKTQKSLIFIESLSIRCSDPINWDKFIDKVEDYKVGLSIPNKKNGLFQDKEINIQPIKKAVNLKASF